MDKEQITQPRSEKPSLGQLWRDIKKHKKLYYKVLSITFVVSAIFLLGTPNYYKCTVKLAPELSGSSGSTSSLANIASSFGIKLGTGNAGSEALFPTLYPDLMNSVAFRASLFPIKIHREDDERIMTYYDYLNDEQKMSILEYSALPLKWGKEYVVSLFKDEQGKPGKVNPFKLTKEQYEVVKTMEKKVVCDVDKKTLVITIDVTDQDPLIAATMADSVQMHLQEFITDYRTRKARIDLEYNQKLYKEAQDRYEQARRRSAAYNDANQHVIFDRIRSEQVRLENEMNIQYQAYSQISAQLRLSEAKVQEDTPAFTMLQPASVPIKKEGPKRTIVCLFILILATMLTSIYVIHKEDHLKSFIRSGQHDFNVEELSMSELIHLISTSDSKSKEESLKC